MTKELKVIDTIMVTDTDFDQENDGVLIVKIFDKRKFGLGISLKRGADGELWLSSDEARKLLSAIEKAINGIND